MVKFRAKCEKSTPTKKELLLPIISEDICRMIVDIFKKDET